MDRELTHEESGCALCVEEWVRKGKVVGLEPRMPLNLDGIPLNPAPTCQVHKGVPLLIWTVSSSIPQGETGESGDSYDAEHGKIR